MNQRGSVRGSYRNGVARRQQIVEKAAEVFAAVGYHGGSMRQIAHEVGVTPAALGRHFASKEDLLVAVMEWWRLHTDEHIGGAAHGLSFFTELRSLLEYHIDNRGLLELFFILTSESSNPDHPAAPFLRKRYSETVEWFARELGIAYRNGEIVEMSSAEAEAEARTVVALLDGIEVQWLLDEQVDMVALYQHNLGRLIVAWKRAW